MARKRTPPQPAAATPPAASSQNAQSLEREVAWFRQVLTARFQIYFEQEDRPPSIYAFAPPPIAPGDSAYAELVTEHKLGFDERVLLMLAVLPSVRPEVLDDFFIKNKGLDRPFTEFGGWKGETHGGFLPTGETAAFVLSAGDLAKRFELMAVLDAEHPLFAQGVLQLQPRAAGEPQLSSLLLATPETLQRITRGTAHRPDYSSGFPAKRLTTALRWEDLVLAPDTAQAVAHLKLWLEHSDKLLHRWGLSRALKPGYRTLFYGPPGTGKTLTACLVGASCGLDVYRVDLSMIVSKFIGETQRNLAALFDQAEHKRWVLFFDEADALFARRTGAHTSNDRHANQEVAYLLQRVEDFPGVVILATNLRSNLDTAFARRFQSVVHFPMPDEQQRLRLWQSMTQGNEHLADDVDLQLLATRWELSGGALTNVLRYGALSACQQGREQICQADLVEGIARELRKEGKTL